MAVFSDAISVSILKEINNFTLKKIKKETATQVLRVFLKQNLLSFPLQAHGPGAAEPGVTQAWSQSTVIPSGKRGTGEPQPVLMSPICLSGKCEVPVSGSKLV